MEPTIDGIAFGSARCQGSNIVVFADQRQCSAANPNSLLIADSKLDVYRYGPPVIAPERQLSLFEQPLHSEPPEFGRLM